SANRFTWSCVTSNHSPVPSSLPTSAWNRGNAFSADALMPRTLGAPIMASPGARTGAEVGGARSFDARGPGTVDASCVEDRSGWWSRERRGAPGVGRGWRGRGPVDRVGRGRDLAHERPH